MEMYMAQCGIACPAACERSQPVYNYQPNGCGTTYITIGDGGAVLQKI
jgi:hypothetical protein